MSFDVGFLFNQFPRLPLDIIFEIFGYLLGADVLKCFICLKKSESRKAVIDSFFKGRMVFDFYPRPYLKQDPFPVKLSWWSYYSAQWNFYLEVGIEDFLDSNPDIIPPRLTLRDKNPKRLTSNSYFKKYASSFFKKVSQLWFDLSELDQDFDFLVDSFPNVHWAKLYSIEPYFSQSDGGFLLKWKDLQLLRVGGTKLNDWSKLQFPPGLKTFELSYCSNIDFSTLVLPDSVENITIYNSDEHLSHKPRMEYLYDFLPSNLKTLVIFRYQTTCMIELNVQKLPRTLKRFEMNNMVLLSVHTEDENTNCSVVWPHSLESMKFTRCNVDDRILKQLDSIGWPANLRHLELFDLEFSSLAFLNNLPQTLDELNMVYCYSAQFSAFEDSPKRIQFPKYLRRLNLASCRIGSLSILEFPPFLRELDLSGDRLHDLLEYEGGDIRWIDLVYLESIVLKYNSISSLRSWFPPVSLKYLNLCGCDLSEITGEAPIFNERQNKVYSNLRRIDLTNTHLFRIDDSVCVPPNVYKLDLVCNTNLESIPLHSKFFTSRLCELDLYNTPFNDLSIHNSYFDDKIKYVTFPEGPFHEFS